ncbi:Planctomycete cytochrome C [Rubripirellula lacrimiformis]|uniref:Planctomycete cytochrome C n=1 Tax=Rubripirellula lacrimiformis TaxID=1930273 RepID=A0A517NBS1_9BACT|nr:PSD1 and planctomycete cytochrome C domain-containing protein [Rubripirellula lacrimiformis]QDT04586.1 Planctomycete cytochrome C [Rubripirellula lacrimiformis]
MSGPAFADQPDSVSEAHASIQPVVDFNRDIRTVLSDKCFLCHGPDESTREAGLRLDIRDEAIDAGAIYSGDSLQSEIIARVTSDDPDLVMPPPDTGKKVTADEIAALQAWIDSGAAYDTHWAFLPPAMPDLPKVKDSSWPRNAVDRFTLAKMESMGLHPSPQADAATLSRRISLDLIGLPTTIAEIDTVESVDPLDDALAALIDDRMSSRHFGERWGRWWLDAARYADSAGYEKDMQRQVFFYRDWVIDAINRDMPYDQFVIHQIAGDLIPDASQAERVATGFLRNSMTNEEGGADPEQFRIEGMFDRVDAIGKAIMGVTTQCAQCHTHKYDPISHHEYYQMFASLNDFHEACVSVFTPQQAMRRDEVLANIAGQEAALRRHLPGWKQHVANWAAEASSKLPHWNAVTPTDIPYEGQKFAVLDDGSIVSESYAPTKAANSFSLTLDVGTITAVRLDALTHPQLPRGGPGRSIDGTGALSEFKLTVTPSAKDAKPIEVKFVRAVSDVNPPQRDLKKQYRDRDPQKDKRVVGAVEFAIDGDEKTAWTTDIGPGRSNQSRHAIFIPESPIVVDGEATLTFQMIQKHGGWNSDDNQNFLIGRYRFSITDSPQLPRYAIHSAVESILATPSSQWSDDQWDGVFSQWRQLPPDVISADWAVGDDNPPADLSKLLADCNDRIEQEWSRFPETASQLVAVALPEARETFVFTRGDFLSPADPVQPGTPEFMNPMPQGASPDRLRFARWLVSEDSPTAARVIVNRIWQAYFGRGLVVTPEDFGFQSAPPSHPELLDYLAIELMEHDWSMKHIHRLIVDSATYRQSSIAPPSAWRNDPTNQWLTRGPRFRMDAEMVRDLALSVSGLLDLTIGGPSVYPPAPDFLFQPPASYGPKIWDTDTDGSQYRRSLYVHQYRSVPYPPLQVFDAPKGDAATVRRARSNTPLQALVLLNEPQFLEISRSMASGILGRGEWSADDAPDLDRMRIIHVFRACTGRVPADSEIRVLVDLLDAQRETFAELDNDSLEKFVGVSSHLCRQLVGVESTELAAWMVVARTILNLDETITKS